MGEVGCLKDGAFQNLQIDGRGDVPRANYVVDADAAGNLDFSTETDASDKVIIATYGGASVGINIPRIFNLVLLEPGKSFVRVIQSIGRGIRKANDKDFVQIWAITSTCRFAKRHLTKR